MFWLASIFMLIFVACSKNEHKNEQIERDVDICDIEETIRIEEPDEDELTWILADFAVERNIEPGAGLIFLYGEWHGNLPMLNMQFERWYYYYHYHGMRHLFMEAPMFTTEILNMWMQEENDDLLYLVFDPMLEQELRVPRDLGNEIDIMKRIKAHTPETVFHGSDIGNMHQTDGQWFLQHLRDNGLEQNEQYLLTLELIQQRYEWEKSGFIEHVRADMMVQHFVREFDKLGGENIMSFFWGDAHAWFGYYHECENNPSAAGGVTKATQLRDIYGGRVFTTDMPLYLGIRRGEFTFGVKIGTGTFNLESFGLTYMGFVSDRFESIEFIRIHSRNAPWNVHEVFSVYELTGVVLPYHNFPVEIRADDVFMVIISDVVGESNTFFFRTKDGAKYGGVPMMVEFMID